MASGYAAAGIRVSSSRLCGAKAAAARFVCGLFLGFLGFALSACGGGASGGGGGGSSPLPQIMKTGENGRTEPLSQFAPQKVFAEAGGDSPVLTMIATNGGGFLPFANGDFESDGGETATIRLSRDAENVFSTDGALAFFVLTATNALGTTMLTLSLASAPLPRDGADLAASFTIPMIPAGAALFSSSEAGLTISHNNDAAEQYELSGPGASLFAVDAAGAVRAAKNISLGGIYELVLRLTDGNAIAHRSLKLDLCAGQWPCREQFAAALSLAVENKQATLNHQQAVVLDIHPYHGGRVSFVFRKHGSGASVRLTTLFPSRYEFGRGYPIDGIFTSDIFSRLPPKKKIIAVHSIAHLIANEQTMKEKDAIVVQAGDNHFAPPHSPHFYFTENYLDPTDQAKLRPAAFSMAQAVVSTGLMIVAGGIQKCAPESDDYCPIYTPCGWAAEYCMVAPASGVEVGEGKFSGGNSYSAPQIGAALQMLSAMWPDLSQFDLAALALELADDMGEPGIDPTFGHGRLSFRKLYQPGGMPQMTENGLFIFSCDAAAKTCQKSRPL